MNSFSYLGHGVGDELLKSVADRLMNCVRLVDSVSRGQGSSEPMVSRLGGDEFIVMLSAIRDDREAVLIAERILRFADIVGRERVMAGTDCGFGTFAGFGAVHPTITFGKLAALTEGAALASAKLW